MFIVDKYNFLEFSSITTGPESERRNMNEIA
jgi:hypothetical protein